MYHIKHLTFFTKPTNTSMSTEKIQFKEYPRPGNLGLESAENGFRSKFPNCYDLIQPAKGKDGRWITGMDEDSFRVNTITDSKLRESEKERIKSLRESLERLTGKDLSGLSAHWNTYMVAIDTSKPLDMSNPEDVIAYNVIIANGEAAPSIKSAREGTISQRQSKYYVSRENEDVSDKVARKKEYNKAINLFTELIEDPDRTLLIGKYLGLRISEGTPQNNRYDLIQEFLDRDEQLGSVSKFLLAMDKSPEELNIKMIFDEAVKLKSIRYDTKSGLYQRGNITFGNNPKKALETLSLPEMSGELLSIKEEVENKRKFG